MPGHKLAARCLAEDPDERPQSMDEVIKELKGVTGRRQWLERVAIIMGLGAGAVYLRDRWLPKIPLGSRQRVRVNGFAPSDDQSAKALRTLLMMALRQSPLLNVVGDRGYLAADGRTIVKAGFAFPFKDLLKTAREEKSNLIIDGSVFEASQGAKLRLTVYDVEKNREAYRTEVAVADKRQLVRLAELAATNLRKEAFGESAFHSSYRPLDKITSSSPAAVDLYFRAVYHYEQRDAGSALTLLDQALTIDPSFVLAHHYKALVLSAQEMLESAEASAEKAFSLRGQVTDRERNWIESQYYNIVRAWRESAAALTRNTILFPDEAVFERQLAFALMRLGEYEEALPHNRRAVDLDPFSENNRMSCLPISRKPVGLRNVLSKPNTFQIAGRLPNFASYGLGLAYLQQGNYTQSLNQFGLLRESDAGGPVILPYLRLGAAHHDGRALTTRSKLWREIRL